MLKIVIPNTYYDAAEGVLTWFENSNMVKWNKNGDIIYPSLHLNIVNVIGYIVNSRKKITNMSKLDYIHSLLHFISFPPELVANKKIRDLLSSNNGDVNNSRLVEYKPRPIIPNPVIPRTPPQATPPIQPSPSLGTPKLPKPQNNPYLNLGTPPSSPKIAAKFWRTYSL